VNDKPSRSRSQILTRIGSRKLDDPDFIEGSVLGIAGFCPGKPSPPSGRECIELTIDGEVAVGSVPRV
jgi:hypothetical protein